MSIFNINKQRKVRNQSFSQCFLIAGRRGATPYYIIGEGAYRWQKKHGEAYRKISTLQVGTNSVVSAVSEFSVMNQAEAVCMMKHLGSGVAHFFVKKKTLKPTGIC